MVQVVTLPKFPMLRAMEVLAQPYRKKVLEVTSVRIRHEENLLVRESSAQGVDTEVEIEAATVVTMVKMIQVKRMIVTLTQKM